MYVFGFLKHIRMWYSPISMNLYIIVIMGMYENYAKVADDLLAPQGLRMPNGSRLLRLIGLVRAINYFRQ